MDFDSLKKTAFDEIKQIKSAKELANFRIKYLGRKGKITGFLKDLVNLPVEERRDEGKKINIFKKELEEFFKEVQKKTRQISDKKDFFDITAPGKKILIGHLHILTQVRRRIEEIFERMGFSVAEGPETETEYYNFDALNIPANHPARDLWDTFWLEPISGKLLLRTHTSPVQIRYMENHQPPLRIIAPGRCFRHEATDAGHDVQFHQVEGLMVDKNISISNFKAILRQFFKFFFGREVELRLRPSYFPFVEPGFEVDISCPKHSSAGLEQVKCSLCGGTGYLEVMGAGMVHPNVFRTAGHNPDDWQGFAFGLGVERLAMIKYKINDIRLFHSGDLRFLKQF